MKDQPIIFKRIHRMLLKRADPEGRIERRKLFEVIAERVGRIEEKERNVLVFELQTYGIISRQDKLSFTIQKA